MGETKVFFAHASPLQDSRASFQHAGQSHSHPAGDHLLAWVLILDGGVRELLQEKKTTRPMPLTTLSCRSCSFMRGSCGIQATRLPTTSETRRLCEIVAAASTAQG